ncbi:MAG: thioesterase family protein [Propioniciclava sp.]|uniref:acyl-CoA thioesterase n=1 Tax=Propioniciclava sp. TaxID=2038686 RepID=UPI0039E50B1E
MTELHLVRVPVRWADLDAQDSLPQRWANDAVILDYLQEARVDFLLRGPNAHLLGGGIIVVEHQVEYLAPIRGGVGEVEVGLSVGDVRAAQFTVGYEVYAAGERVARARTLLCNFDFATQRPARMADAERRWFTERSVPLDPLRDVGDYQVSGRHYAHPLVVRWSDLDAYGHANNTRFYDYVGEARVGMLGAPSRGSAWLVVRQDMRYIGQIEHRLEPYQVQTSVAALGRTSLTLAARIVDSSAGRTLARAVTVLVHADAAGRPQPLPGAVRDLYRRWPAEPKKGNR